MSDFEEVEDVAALEQAFAVPQGGQVATLSGTQQAQPGPGFGVPDVVTAQQVARPRNLNAVLQRLKILAAAAGDDWFYSWAVKSKKQPGQKERVEGPSIKCANAVAREYGNCAVDSRAFVDGDAVIIYARFVDLENGFSYVRPFRQSMKQDPFKIAASDPDRQQQIAFSLGVSKAIRNVVNNALETYTTYAFRLARSSIVDRVAKKPEHYRTRIKERLAELDVPLARVEASHGIKAADWTPEDMAKIVAEIQAIGDGMVTVEEAWPGDPAAPIPTRDQAAGAGKTGGKKSQSPPKGDSGGSAQTAPKTAPDGQGEASAGAATSPPASPPPPPAATPAAEAAAKAGDAPEGEIWELWSEHGEQIGVYSTAILALQAFQDAVAKLTAAGERATFLENNAAMVEAAAAKLGDHPLAAGALEYYPAPAPQALTVGQTAKGSPHWPNFLEDVKRRVDTATSQADLDALLKAAMDLMDKHKAAPGTATTVKMMIKTREARGFGKA